MALRGLNRWGGGKVLCSPESRAGNWLGGTSKWKCSEEREERRRGGGPLSRLSSSVSLPHSAVASQLVPRGTWRHLVSVSTGAGTAEGCGLFSSAPAPGEEAADARLQGVTGPVTPEREESADGSAAYFFYIYCSCALHSCTPYVQFIMTTVEDLNF